jgi:hypothetical protein
MSKMKTMPTWEKRSKSFNWKNEEGITWDEATIEGMNDAHEASVGAEYDYYDSEYRTPWTQYVEPDDYDPFNDEPIDDG